MVQCSLSQTSAWRFVLLLIFSVQDGTIASSQTCTDTSRKKESPRRGASQIQLVRETSCEPSQCKKLEEEVIALVNVAANSSVAQNPSCEEFCLDRPGCDCLIPWPERCKVNSCASCLNCTGPTPSPGATPAPPAPSPPGSTPSPPTPDPCLPNAPDLDFMKAKLVENCLGGQGPGPDTSGRGLMRFQGVGTANGKNIDVVVELAQGAAYRPNNASNNGLNCGNSGGQHGTGHIMCTEGAHLGQINLGSNQGNSGTGEVTELMFKFEDSFTKTPVTIPQFYVSYFDIDQNKGNGPVSKVRERFKVYGVQRALYETPNDMDITMTGDEVLVKSMKMGKGCDNPEDPFDLKNVSCDGNTVDQRKRAVTFLMKGAAQWKVTYETTCNNCPPDGRNFLFGLKSALVDLC